VVKISWDDTKEPYDGTNDDVSLIKASDWNSMVTDQKLRAIIGVEDKRGADCSGSDSALNRVLTLANTTLTDKVFVFVNGLILHSADVTISHLSASSTVTFLNAVWDTDYIKCIKVQLEAE
jgi:hypothetical protein